MDLGTKWQLVISSEIDSMRQHPLSWVLNCPLTPDQTNRSNIGEKLNGYMTRLAEYKALRTTKLAKTRY